MKKKNIDLFIQLIKNLIYEYNLIKIKIIKQIMMINNQRE